MKKASWVASCEHRNRTCNSIRFGAFVNTCHGRKSVNDAAMRDREEWRRFMASEVVPAVDQGNALD